MEVLMVLVTKKVVDAVKTDHGVFFVMLVDVVLTVVYGTKLIN